MPDLLQFPATLYRAENSDVPDAAERAQALDITRSFIVEAPAGSGKTGLLIQRLLKLLGSPSVTDPAQILAITFTRKATHEMRDRILAQLAAARRGGPASGAFEEATRLLAEAALEHDRQLGWNLLDHPGRLNIRSIDSLCTQITESLPILSGAGGQSPVEDAGELYAEAARNTLLLLGGPDTALNDALEVLLLHRDGNLADCETLIAEMLPWRDQWANLVPVTADQLGGDDLEQVTLPRIEKALEHAICRALTELDRRMPPPLLDDLAALARRMAHAEGYQGADSPIALCRELTRAPGTAAADVDHWRALARLVLAPSSQEWRKPRGLSTRNLGFELTAVDKAELAGVIESLSSVPGLQEALCTLSKLPPLRYPAEQWYVAKRLFRVLSRALVELQLVFAARRQCDFTESSLLARQALRNPFAHDDLAASANLHLQHLLVDEMQDTSAAQYELIRLLTQHWDGHTQTVFLVGDPKQSIYLFRQARVARFLATLRTGRLGDLPLNPLYLTANFRSQAGLVHSFNQTFSAIFPAPPEAGRSSATNPETVPFRHAHATRPAASGLDLVWHATLTPYDPANKSLNHQMEIRRNAAEIRTIVEHRIEQWRSRQTASRGHFPRIAVLVRNRTHLIEIVRALKQPGETGAIPFRAVKIEPLAERQEVLDLLSLTRALLHPADRTAWLALLRTPWCGLTLRDLHLLAGQDDRRLRRHTVLQLIEQRGDLLSEDGQQRLRPFWTILAAALAARGSMPLSRWVERTWRAFGAEAFASAEELANVHRFLQLLDQLEAQPQPVTIQSLSRGLAGLYAAASSAEDAVDLMTIHNAKGLEWDVVLVPQLESGSGRNRPRLLEWLELEAGADADLDPEIAHGILAPVPSKGTSSQALNQWLRSVASRREAAERQRLFYVACTRAREELHIFAAPAQKKNGEPDLQSDSLLKAAWPAAAPFFAAAAHAPQQTPGRLDQIAAAGIALVPPPARPARTVQRIPLGAMHAPPPPPPEQGRAGPFRSFARPEGSLLARGVGNALHALLELVAQRVKSGDSFATLLGEVPGWTPRIVNVLRAQGLAPDAASRQAAGVLRALTRTLHDADGRWILSPHPEAASEAALVAGASSIGSSIRLDRTFLAGAAPQSEGSSHRWIVDFKTSTHGAGDLDAFLDRERESYAPQLEHYAAQLAPGGLPIRLALYYPALAKLVWWRSGAE